MGDSDDGTWMTQQTWNVQSAEHFGTLYAYVGCVR